MPMEDKICDNCRHRLFDNHDEPLCCNEESTMYNSYIFWFETCKKWEAKYGTGQK